MNEFSLNWKVYYRSKIINFDCTRMRLISDVTLKKNQSKNLK